MTFDVFRKENLDHPTEIDLEEVTLRPHKRRRDQSSKAKKVASGEVLENDGVGLFRIDKTPDFDDPLDSECIVTP